MSLTVGPERYSAPPVDTCTMPSLPASANPRIAALSVCEDDTLMAGYAKDPAFARSSMSAYTSGVAMGMGSPSGHQSDVVVGADPFTPTAAADTRRLSRP